MNRLSSSPFVFAAIAVLVAGGSGVQRQVFLGTPSPERGSSCRAFFGPRPACERHLRDAEQQATAAIYEGAGLFTDFVWASKPGAAAFAKVAVSLRGKWQAVKSFLPFTDPDGHKRYLRERFAEHIFSERELEQALRASLESTLRELESVENHLAVALREETTGRRFSAGEKVRAAQDFQSAVALTGKLTMRSELSSLQ